MGDNTEMGTLAVTDAEVVKLAQFRQLITKWWDKFFTMGDPPDSLVSGQFVNKFSWLDGVEGDELEAPSKSACARGVFSKE